MNHTAPQRLKSARSPQTLLELATSLASRLHSSPRIFVVLAALCLAGTSSLHAQWTQVWGGGFPGAAGTTYDHTKWWNNVQPTAVWGDGTIQNTSDSLQNAYLDGNGDLIIAMTYNPNNAVQYTSARLTSTYNAGPYGRIDARIQNPSAVGMGAAFWALGADAYGPGTGAGLIRTQHRGGHTLAMVRRVGHDGAASLEQPAQRLHRPRRTDRWADLLRVRWNQFGRKPDGKRQLRQRLSCLQHRMGAPYSFTYLLDGVAYASVNLANIGATDQWEFTQPINFILSSGVGGNGGTPNGQGFPSNLVVNYVNYSQLTAGAPGPVTGLTATASYSNAVTLNWTASTTAGVTYVIYATTTSGTAPTLSTLVAQNVTATSYVNTALMPSTTYYYTVKAANYGGESTAANATVTTQAPGNSTGMQLSAGGYAVGTYMNSNPPQPAVAGAAGPAPIVLGGSTNYHWSAGPPAGLTTVNTSLVSNPAPQAIYNVERWGAAAWTIPGLNPLGGYSVRLHFVDFGSTAVGQRQFNVLINGEQVLTNFDIFAQAGAINTAVAEEFYTTADENGIIEIQTTVGAVDQPTIEAIEIIPTTGSNPVGATPGTTADLAINSGGAAAGTFIADEDFNGGDTATSTTAVTTNANSAPAAVYLSERYVPFTYVLTGLVADAPYTVKMHFAETYWTGAGERIFSVQMNGKYVLNDLDVFKTAGGENIAYDPQFTATADRFGQIIVTFIYGGADQPFIDGIEAVKSGNASCSAIPSSPANLAATASSSSAIGLSWSAVDPASELHDQLVQRLPQHDQRIYAWNRHPGGERSDHGKLCEHRTRRRHHLLLQGRSHRRRRHLRALGAGFGNDTERWRWWHLQRSPDSSNRSHRNRLLLKRDRPELDSSHATGELHPQLLQRLRQHHQRLHSGHRQPALEQRHRNELLEHRPVSFDHVLLQDRSRRLCRHLDSLGAGLGHHASGIFRNRRRRHQLRRSCSEQLRWRRCLLRR